MLITTLLCAAAEKPGPGWKNWPLTSPSPHDTRHHTTLDLREHRPVPPPPPPPYPASPRPQLASPLQAGPIFAPASQSKAANPAAPQTASPWPGASLSLLRRRPRDLTLLRPAEFSLSCLHAAKFARLLFRRFSLHNRP